MEIKTFVDAYRSKKFMNIKTGVDERIEWIKKELEVKEYISFNDKRKIAEMIVENNIKIVDGVKKYDSINAYVELIISTITAYTNLSFGNNPIADYDLLAESGLLPQIMAILHEGYDEIGCILKMAAEMELESNSVGALIGKFLDEILKKLSGLADSFDMKQLLGNDFTEENLAALSGLLDKLK